MTPVPDEAPVLLVHWERTLVRLCFERRLLARAGLEQVMRNLDEAGRMLGGWRRLVDGS